MTRAIMHLIWKDYRAMLPFWISVGALGMLMQLGVVMFEDQDAASLEPLFTTTLVFIALYGLGCGAALFAGECEDGTRELLRTLPLSPTPLLTAKLVLAVLSLAAMVVALFGSAAYMNSQFLGRIQQADTEYIFVASGLAWGILFSIYSARPLTAACLGAAGAVLANYIAMGVVGMTMHDSYWWQGINTRDQLLLHSFSPCMGILLVVILIDIVAGLRWLGSDPSSSGSRLSWSVSKGRSVGRLGWAASKWGWAVSRRSVTSVAAVINRPARSAIWARLAWVHVQQMARIWAVIGGSGLLITLLAIQINRHGNGQNFLNSLGPVIIGVVAIFGASVFMRDQEQSQFRFFANHGVSPRDFWWVRQIVGLSVVGLWILSVWAVCSVAALSLSSVDFSQYFFVDNYDRWTSRRSGVIPIKSETLTAILQFSLVVATAYSAGQFCSLVIRKGIAAVAGGLMLGVTLCAWAALMIYCEISLLLSVMPIPIVLLFASRIRASQWLVDRGGVRNWTRVALSIVIPLTAMIANMGYQRANGIPVIKRSPTSVYSPLNKNPYQGEFLQLNLSKYSRPVTADERKTAKMYGDIRSVLVPYSRITAEYKERGKKDGTEYTGRWFGNLGLVFSPFKDLTVSDEAIEWIDRNERALEKLLVATERETCVLFNPVTDDTDLTRDSFYNSLENLLLGSGRVLTDRGELDAAWKSYRALIRYSVHRNQRSPWIRGQRTRQNVYGHLAYWASRPGQTVERIRDVMEQLDELDQFEPTLKDHIGYNNVLMCRVADGDVAAMLLCDKKIDPTFLSVTGGCFPWERQRARLALARQYDWELEQRSRIEARMAGGANISPVTELREPELMFQVGRRYYEHKLMSLGHASFLLRPFGGDMITDTGVRLVQREINRRGVRLQLAISAWRIEHGTLPVTLAELVPDYFDKEPLDPVTGQPFGYVRPDTYPKSERLASNDMLYEKKHQIILPDNFLWSLGLHLTCDTYRQYGNYGDDLHGGVEDADGNLVEEDRKSKLAWWRAYHIPDYRRYYGPRVSSEMGLYRRSERFPIYPLHEDETCAEPNEKQ